MTGKAATSTGNLKVTIVNMYLTNPGPARTEVSTGLNFFLINPRTHLISRVPYEVSGDGKWQTKIKSQIFATISMVGIVQATLWCTVGTI